MQSKLGIGTMKLSSGQTEPREFDQLLQELDRHLQSAHTATTSVQAASVQFGRIADRLGATNGSMRLTENAPESPVVHARD